jgi:hypothetical protein
LRKRSTLFVWKWCNYTEIPVFLTIIFIIKF